MWEDVGGCGATGTMWDDAGSTRGGGGRGGVEGLVGGAIDVGRGKICRLGWHGNASGVLPRGRGREFGDEGRATSVKCRIGQRGGRGCAGRARVAEAVSMDMAVPVGLARGTILLAPIPLDMWYSAACHPYVLGAMGACLNTALQLCQIPAAWPRPRSIPRRARRGNPVSRPVLD